MDIALYKNIKNWANDLDGVFVIQDLRVAFHNTSSANMYRNLQALEESGDLIRIKRGCYATPDAKLSTISARMYPRSYISMGTVLAAHKVIGSTPERKLQAVKIGSPTSFTCRLGTIEYLSIAPKLFFGFERKENINWATVEKAYLDACYFYYKRKTFSFDLEVDVDKSSLNQKTINQYLKKYDRRFLSFFRKTFGGND
jgi:predicted transcriptional regulator of viral defense system